MGYKNWVEGTGVDQERAEAEAEAGAEPAAGPAIEALWEVIYGSTVEGAGRAEELDGTLRAFVAAVEVDGAKGDDLLAKQLDDLGGQEGWRLGSVRLTAGDLAPAVSAVCGV